MTKIEVAILCTAGFLGQRFIDRLRNHPTFESVALVDVIVLMIVVNGIRMPRNGGWGYACHPKSKRRKSLSGLIYHE